MTTLTRRGRPPGTPNPAGHNAGRPRSVAKLRVGDQVGWSVRTAGGTYRPLQRLTVTAVSRTAITLSAGDGLVAQIIWID